MKYFSPHRPLTQVLAGSFIVVIFSAHASARTQSSPHRHTVSQKAKLRRAQALGKQIVQRFHEALDFEGIFKEHFVTEPQLRAKALGFGEDKVTHLGEAADARQFVSLLTFLHLWAEYKIAQDPREAPPEVEKSHPTIRLIDDSKFVPKTLDELNQAVAELDGVSAIYRSHLPPEIFRGSVYREAIEKMRAEAARRHRASRIEAGNAKFGIPEKRPVYIVRPELFDYYFVEENGAMKLFYVDILPDFRLF